ncbi:Predicted PurR-regulated permease PerM [Rhizobium sp. RU20A]|uniref:AI-2E family transporter n=1 Tax=Rhizobium sp. RU20A TaxID=1907412 RepID=UPI000954A03F|nr:AI-2E family transporter [Rhizobium sp. RU20A]SIQ52843.1 Predicted PurR-regulated permease PerM [Rhizobium sp. RU20A]
MNLMKRLRGGRPVPANGLEPEPAADPAPRRQVTIRRDGFDYAVIWSIIGLFVLAASAAIYTMKPVLMPITMAIVVGTVLGAGADRLGRFGVPPVLGGLTLALLLASATLFLVNRLADPVANLFAQAPQILEGTLVRLQPLLGRVRLWELTAGAGTDDKVMTDMVMQHAGTVVSFAASGLTPAIIQILIFIAALGLFLVGRVELRKTLIMASAHRERRLAAIRIMNAIEAALGFYFSTASLIYAALGVITMGIAFMGGLALAPIWGFFAFLSSFVPYLGVTVMTLALAAGGLMTHDALLIALFPAIAFFVLHLLMENLLMPSILGSRLEVNPFIIFTAIIFWTWMWGAVGAMIAMPLCLIAMTIFEEVRPKAPERHLPG